MRSRFARQAAGGAWWSAVEIATRFGLQFLAMWVLARLLQPDDFGLIALLLIFTEIGTLLIDSGFGIALIQRQHITADDETTVFVFSIVVGVLLTVVLELIAPLVAQFFHVAQMIPLLRVMALTLPFNALGVVPSALLTMRLDFRRRAIAQVLASATAAATAIIMASHEFGVWSLVWQVLLTSAIRSLCLWLFSGWQPRGHFQAAAFTSLGRFGGSMLVSGLLNTAYLQSVPLLIGRLFDTRSLGYFTLAANTQQGPASLMGNILAQAGFPVFAAISQQPTRLREALRAMLRMSMFIFFPCMIGIAVTAKPLVLVIYGERWLPAAPLLSILALGGSLWPVHVLNQEAIKALGRSDLFLRLAWAKITLALTLLAVGSQWGTLGVALAALVSSVCSAFINSYFSWRLLGYGAIAQSRDQLATFLLAGAAAPIGWISLHYLPIGMLGITLAIMSAAAVYIGLAFVLRVQAMRDLRSFLHASFGKRIDANE